MWDPQITIEEVNDPVEVERHREQREQFKRNCDWLQAHWPDLLPAACGKFLAVAGQEPFLADTPDEAWAWAAARHPEDKGPLVQFVLGYNQSRVRSSGGGFSPMWNPQITIEEVNDPGEAGRRREHRERARKNWDWLQAHWPDLLPQAYGRFVAVADQRAFVAETLEAALAWVRANHPDDTGHIVEYVWPETGPRSYSFRLC